MTTTATHKSGCFHKSSIIKETMSKHNNHKKEGGLQAVILAAGKGTRMLPLTLNRPKPLQCVLGKSLIAWKLEALPARVDEIIIVIGYQGEQIQAEIGNSYQGKKIQYVVQKELNGTAGALLSAKELLGERFLVMMGDDLYAKEDVAMIAECEWGVCVAEVFQKEMGGEMKVNKEGNFFGIREEKHYVERGLVNTGLYMLRHEILDIEPVLIGVSSREFGLPHTLAVIAQHTPVSLVVATGWMQVTTAEDLKRAERFVVR